MFDISMWEDGSPAHWYFLTGLPNGDSISSSTSPTILEGFCSQCSTITQCRRSKGTAFYCNCIIIMNSLQYVVYCFIFRLFICAQVLETTLMHLSDQMVQSIEEVTLLHQVVSYHVAYHMNEVHFVQYRALGNIFQDLHCLVQDHLSQQLQGTAAAPSSTTVSTEVICHIFTLNSHCTLLKISTVHGLPLCSL